MRSLLAFHCARHALSAILEKLETSHLATIGLVFQPHLSDWCYIIELHFNLIGSFSHKLKHEPACCEITRCLVPGTVKRQRSKVRSKVIKVRARLKFSNFTAMDDARSWSELLSAIISHFGRSILWHIGMTRQYDVQWDTTRQNQHSTGKLICKINIFYSETSQIASGHPVFTP